METSAKPSDIARVLSLTSASIEKIENFKKDYLYHIEITTNRIDMVSVIGIAREAAAVLPQFGFAAKFVVKKFISATSAQKGTGKDLEKIDIQSSPKLVRRICAVILAVKQGESPQYIKDRLEAAGMSSKNNLVDITNYLTIEAGHPSHVFDYDRLTARKLVFRESQKGDKIIDLHGVSYSLPGGDIVIDDGNGDIIDLPGIIGTANSSVTNETKTVLFFIDNNDPVRIRKTSMTLNIRTEAAAINEKNPDPELAIEALYRGIDLFEKLAGAKIKSQIIDIYPNKHKEKTIKIPIDKICKVIGVDIKLKEAESMLKRLGFGVKTTENNLMVSTPSFREADIEIEEDIIEEIARIYGYHNIPSRMPPATDIRANHFVSEFFWEDRVKDALKYWGFTECYTYSMISEKMAQKNTNALVKIKNPLDDDHVYMRSSLIPSLIEVCDENKERENIRIFELAKVYVKKQNALPDEIRTLAGVIKGMNSGFFEAKGVVEQILIDLGIKNYEFKEGSEETAKLFVEKEFAGIINILQGAGTVFEINFDLVVKSATDRKTYKPASKFPPFVEDLALVVDSRHKTGDIIADISRQSSLIRSVELFDKYENTRTFHIVYQSYEKNLSRDEIAVIREKILASVKQKFHAITK